MGIEPYLFFEGRCDEAIEFYRAAIGAEVGAVMRYREAPDPAMCKPGLEDKVMHAVLRIGGSSVMLSDGRCEGRPEFKGFALTLSAADPAEAERLFSALSSGGSVVMPLTRTFYSPCFGMLADRFGVMWMIIVPQ